MTVTLTLEKEDLISLVKGTMPNYNVMNHELIKGQGGLSQNGWQWNYLAFNGYDEHTLLGVYELLKNSWKVRQDE